MVKKKGLIDIISNFVKNVDNPPKELELSVSYLELEFKKQSKENTSLVL